LRGSQIHAVAPDHEQLTDTAKFNRSATVNGGATVNGTAAGRADIVSDTQGSTQAGDAGTDHRASDRAGVVLASAARLATERRGVRAERTDLSTKALPRPAGRAET
jgi:hypothetical protein